jgi:hypothetical protein
MSLTRNGSAFSASAARRNLMNMATFVVRWPLARGR